MITFQTPANLVIQRDETDRAVLPISGTCDLSVSSVFIKLVPVKEGWGTELEVTLSVSAGKFNDTLTVKKGWYNLIAADEKGETQTQKIGVGDVFLVSGHSIASNNGKGYPTDLPIGERVITLDFDNAAVSDLYNQKLDPSYIQFKFVPVSLRSQVAIGSDPQHWGNMAHQLSEKFNVPVLVINVAYGGSNLEMWEKGIRGQKYGYFDNPDGERAPGQVFNWEKPMPWGTQKQVLEKIISKTGIRAVLSHHGENDKQRTPEQVAGYYKTLIETTRQYAPDVPWLINRASVCGRKQDGSILYLTEVRQAQELTIKNVPKCYTGPDYDADLNQLKPGADEILNLSSADRYDDLHLNVAGLRKASTLWANSINSQMALLTPYVPVKPATQTNTKPDTLAVPPNPKKDKDYTVEIAVALLGVITFLIVALRKE
ncbi:hypothetical protein BWI97_14200 [Siphonobacter sp. BAB-5405]|uniref:hypothetical protein n=1 Tax=Siphonobacter sp. BAB-5405 TaxID=1864825 RepID=UPI000C80B3B1|nr:hypothetical protein [Siphonobacter sp. BAB-5405]PMD95503.1 hypothetical protein BWI97_14200 [Siphonobacter sp. BAB-5405]